jgi:hypothetical protein
VGRLALTLLVAGDPPPMAIVIGFAVGFTSPGHRILKAIGIKTAPAIAAVSDQGC